MAQVDEYNKLKIELREQQSLYLKYVTGPKCSNLESIQLANKARNQCKVIKSKINKLENETNNKKSSIVL